MTARDPLHDLVVTRKPHRWFVWRDIVTLLLAVAVVLLVMQVRGLTNRLTSSSELHTQQLQALTGQIEGLQSRTAQQNARIKQLTDQIIAAGLTPVPAPGATPTRPATPPTMPAPAPVPSRSNAPAPGPTAAPRATPSPSPRPTSGPSPTPSPTRPPLICVSRFCVG